MNRQNPNLIVLCVDGRKDCDLSGRIYTKFSQEPGERFRSMGELFYAMEDFFAAAGTPRQTETARSFSWKLRKNAEERKIIVQNPEKLLNHNGKLSTFVIQVKYRQNATWQGNIVWADTNKESGFRSALEMMKLIDSALYQAERLGTDTAETEPDITPDVTGGTKK